MTWLGVALIVVAVALAVYLLQNVQEVNPRPSPPTWALGLIGVFVVVGAGIMVFGH